MPNTDVKSQITISAQAFDDLVQAAAFASGVLQSLSFTSSALYDEQRQAVIRAFTRINAANDAAIEAMKVS